MKKEKYTIINLYGKYLGLLNRIAPIFSGDI